MAEFNERARRVYERAGFEVVSRHVRSFERFGEVPFLTMAERVRSGEGGIVTRRTRRTAYCSPL